VSIKYKRKIDTYLKSTQNNYDFLGYLKYLKGLYSQKLKKSKTVDSICDFSSMLALLKILFIVILFCYSKKFIYNLCFEKIQLQFKVHDLQQTCEKQAHLILSLQDQLDQWEHFFQSETPNTFPSNNQHLLD